VKTALVIWSAILLSFSQNTSSQSLYSDSSIVEIRIYFTESNWDAILDSLYVDGLEERLMASLSIDGIPYDSVGIRYKGYSSVSVNRVKNPFNIKLDYVIGDQNHQGYDKIKLSNVIQDPSFVREVLSYEIARKYMAASLANFSNVYINDTLIGLYTNVESVKKDFLLKHYKTKVHSFFKGNPESLDLNGENSNLSNTPGTDSADYYPYYELKSDNGWADLYELIDVLNTTPNDIETVLNVDRTLWMHAFNYCLINFDSYVGYAQNYYLYQDHNGQFNPILWDLNMSFASFRLADASEFWDGFTIAEAQVMDPLLHYNSISVYPRPLMRNLFDNDTYRRMYLAHMRTIMEENFDNQWYASRAQELQTMIDTSVLNDTNKFYSYTDFLDNLTVTVTDLIDYPGITELMDARSTYLSTYTGFTDVPAISGITNAPLSPNAGDNLNITATVTDAAEVYLYYRYSAADIFQPAVMLDDGNNGDGGVGDGVYGATLNNVGNVIQYYLYAQNDSAGRFSPERAAYEYYSLESVLGFQDVVINEFMASNSSTQTDENGEADDWIELYNRTSATVSTKGLYLTDVIDTLLKWAMPDFSIEPDGYLIVWADNDTSQGALHANFKLSLLGDEIILSNANGTIIDSVSFGLQMTDISTGRSPNGTGSFTALPPTFGWNNDVLAIPAEEAPNSLFLFPNPAETKFYIQSSVANAQVRITAADGRQVLLKNVNSNNGWIEVDASEYAKGLYLVTVSDDTAIVSQKLIIR